MVLQKMAYDPYCENYTEIAEIPEPPEKSGSWLKNMERYCTNLYYYVQYTNASLSSLIRAFTAYDKGIASDSAGS